MCIGVKFYQLITCKNAEEYLPLNGRGKRRGICCEKPVAACERNLGEMATYVTNVIKAILKSMSFGHLLASELFSQQS